MKILPTWFGRARARVARLQRGSILLLTLFVSFGLCLMIGVLLQATVTQERLNTRSALALESKDAVETICEYAISQMKLKFDTYPGITGSYFITNPITLPSNISTFLWNGTDIDAPNVTLAVGLVPNLSVIYIDPTNPANAFDPDRGKNVSAGDVYVYASATAKNQFGSNTAYATEALEVRNNPLFTNAIFYNMDLEFHPGPSMSIAGPVHCNGNIWAVAETNLTFSGPVTSSGNFNVGLIPWPTDWSNSTESPETGADVFIPNNSGGNTSPYTGSGSQQVSSSYYDSRQTNYGNSTYTNWREMSANLWGGNLQTSANGVPDEQVTGYNDFVFQVNGTSTDLNYAYAIIEPVQNEKFERQASIIVKQLASGYVALTSTAVVTGNSAFNTTVANNYNSTINTTIATTEGNINATVLTMMTNGAIALGTNMTANGSLVLSNGSTQAIAGNLANPVLSNHTLSVPLVTQTQNKTTAGGVSQVANGTGNLMEVSSATYNGTKTTITTTRYVGVAYVEFDTLQSAVNGTTNTLSPTFNTTTQQTDSYGDVVYPGDVIEQPLQVNGQMLNGATVAQNINGNATAASLQGMLQFQPAIGNMTPVNGTAATLTSNTNDVWSGLYDGRQLMQVSVLNLDVGKLKSLVDNNVASYAADSAAFFIGSGNTDFNPATQYNGVVYVEFPELPGNASRLNSISANGTTYPGDAIVDSVNGTSLMLVNATSTANTTGVPNPNYSNTTIGQAGRVNGFTIATNNVMYVYGSFNADGNVNTPETDTTANEAFNDTMPDVPSNPDPVCCLAADAVTCLSGNWTNRASGGTTLNTASPTEVNAAILGGIVPSLKDGSTEESGGSHNFPRFLEDWGSVDFRYRGSMVCLYESEIATRPYTSAGYYSPPNREWGFYNQFAKGIYPPGTPSSRSYYRVNFSYITNVQYISSVAGL
jgi:hypothetical protein